MVEAISSVCLQLAQHDSVLFAPFPLVLVGSVVFGAEQRVWCSLAEGFANF
jgi:hypothetical protein